jgi:NADPH:quinone reductase-like Zn-dependent oxidoreductase
MKAAVVSRFDAAPRYEEFALPAPGADEIVIEMVAAGLHPRVRSQADGSHYTSTDQLPLVPGIDGVGRDAEGRLRYFILPDTALGSMAEQTIIDPRRSIVLPDGSDPILVAAGMNPAMSSWVALRRRIDFRPGQNVVVLGATGNAGRMAVQVAKLFGAGRIVAAARDAAKLAELPALGATDTILLGDDDAFGEAARDADVVIDYLWGDVAVGAMTALVTHREDERRQLSWIAIGSMAGSVAAIPSAALRAARLQIVGSGQGSVSAREFLTELPELAEELTRGTFDVTARAVPLAQVEHAWADASIAGDRVVLVP